MPNKRKRSSTDGSNGNASAKVKQDTSITDLAGDLCNEVRNGINSIAEVKKNKKAIPENSAAFVQSGLALVDLKRLLRSSFVTISVASDTTVKAQQDADKLKLQLQNLQYEQLHLKHEISKCQQFRSRDEDIVLAPQETFFDPTTGPGDVDPELASSEHKLKLARLDWELQSRKNLETELADLKARKKALTQKTLAFRNQLEAMPQQVKAILDAAGPIMKYFGAPEDDLHTRDPAAEHLAQPLYILYAHTAAYRESSDQKLSVKVLGDVDEAKAFLSRSVPEDEEEVEEGGDGDGDGEEDSHRSKVVRKSLEDKQKELLSSHPLSVQITIKCSGKISIHLTFEFLPNLHIVTVKHTTENCSTSDGLNILANLFAGDSGSSPNDTILFKLDQLRMQPFREYIPQIGHPYRWAQVVTGLHTGEQQNESQDDGRTERQSLLTVIQAIRNRVSTQESVALQCKSLAKGKILVDSKKKEILAETIFPLKSQTKLSGWSEFPADDEANGERKFAVTFVRSNWELSCKVSVSPLYPREAPTLILRFVKGTTGVDNNEQAMEAEVNLFHKEFSELGLDSNLLLSHQLRRVQMMMDVYVELHEQDESGTGGSGRLFVRGFKGRDRLCPFKYNPKLKLFEHR